MTARGKGSGSFVWKQTLLVTVSAGNGVKAFGDNISNWPSHCNIKPLFVRANLAATGGPGIFQVKLYDGSNVECMATKPVLVNQNGRSSVRCTWPVSNDVLPQNWDKTGALAEIQHICAVKGSPAKLVGFLEISFRAYSFEIPSACPQLCEYPLVSSDPIAVTMSAIIPPLGIGGVADQLDSNTTSPCPPAGETAGKVEPGSSGIQHPVTFFCNECQEARPFRASLADLSLGSSDSSLDPLQEIESIAHPVVYRRSSMGHATN